MVIAIDGPAGAGKSSVARALAARLGFRFLDSGAMYRAVALSLLERPGSAAERARSLDIEMGARVVVDGRDVSESIRRGEVSSAASDVARDESVRAALVEKQRALVSEGDWVVEGRDIGTVVAPDAELKVFLTASPEERARRRARELGQADWHVVMRDQALRDEHDRAREHSPLRRASDAVELDTSDQALEEVVDEIVALVEEARARR